MRIERRVWEHIHLYESSHERFGDACLCASVRFVISPYRLWLCSGGRFQFVQWGAVLKEEGREAPTHGRAGVFPDPLLVGTLVRKAHFRRGNWRTGKAEFDS